MTKYQTLHFEARHVGAFLAPSTLVAVLLDLQAQVEDEDDVAYYSTALGLAEALDANVGLANWHKYMSAMASRSDEQMREINEFMQNLRNSVNFNINETEPALLGE